MRRLGCSPSDLIRAMGGYFLYRNPCPTVVSIRKPGGHDPRGESLAPLVAFSDLPCRGRGTGRPSRRRRPHPAGCLHPLTAGIGAPVGTAMAAASSLAGRAGGCTSRTLPEPSCLALAPLVAATGVALGAFRRRGFSTTTPTPSGCATRRAPASSPDAGYVSEITSGL